MLLSSHWVLCATFKINIFIIYLRFLLICPISTTGKKKSNLLQDVMAENHELYKEISQLKGLLIKAQNERMALNDIGKCFWYFDHFFSQELCISLPSRPFKMRDLILHLPYCWVFNTKCIFIFDIRFITTILLNSKIFSTIGMDLSFWTSTLSKKGKNLLFCQTLWANSWN